MVKPAIAKASEEETRNITDLKFKGVRKRKWGKWVSEIRLPNSRDRIWLGSYDSAEKAARAFDAAQVCLRGLSARLNFPGISLPIPGVPLTHEEIQTIAARFADSEAHTPEVSLAGSVSEESSVQSDTDSPLESVSGMSNQLEDSNTDLGSYNNLVDFLPELEHSGQESYYKQLDYGIFPGFDELTDNYCDHTIPIIEFGEEKLVDDFLDEEFFLWNY